MGAGLPPLRRHTGGRRAQVWLHNGINSFFVSFHINWIISSVETCRRERNIGHPCWLLYRISLFKKYSVATATALEIIHHEVYYIIDYLRSCALDRAGCDSCGVQYGSDSRHGRSATGVSAATAAANGRPTTRRVSTIILSSLSICIAVLEIYRRNLTYRVHRNLPRSIDSLHPPSSCIARV